MLGCEVAKDKIVKMKDLDEQDKKRKIDSVGQGFQMKSSKVVKLHSLKYTIPKIPPTDAKNPQAANNNQEKFTIPKCPINCRKRISAPILTAEEKFRLQKVHVGSKHQTSTIESYLKGQAISPGDCIESYLSETLEESELDHLSTWKDSKYENVTEKAIREAKHEVKDDDELKDIYHKDWESLRNVKSDEERKKMACVAFKNTVRAEPGRNLTFHGYRGRLLRNAAHRPSFDSFAINAGFLEPLPGFKRKRRRESHVQENTAKTRKIAYKDLTKCMRSLYYSNFESRTKSKKNLQSDFDDFHNFINHCKTLQEESENFLAFYSRKKVLNPGFISLFIKSLLGIDA